VSGPYVERSAVIDGTRWPCGVYTSKGRACKRRAVLLFVEPAADGKSAQVKACACNGHSATMRAALAVKA
jgi:hypothetical protein